ncbi:hypothetical protein HY991_01580 [Candidatus Micrarchaeota archaeon]|nr:hypothetical protein [Candidatus Micrarchaeota archaeon]
MIELLILNELGGQAQHNPWNEMAQLIELAKEARVCFRSKKMAPKQVLDQKKGFKKV